MPLFGKKPKESATELFEKGGDALAEGRLKDVIYYYNKTIKVDPNLARAWFNKGVCLFELGKQREAETLFEKAIQIDPSTRNDLKYFFKIKGDNLSEIGNLKDALSYFERALDVDLNDWSIWVMKGQVLLELNRQDEAIASYKKAAEINPKKATMGVWGVLMTLGRFEEAIPYLDKSIEINPSYNEAWCAKGFCLTALNEMEEALLCLDKALEIEPKDGEAWYLKSMVLSFLHRDKEKIKTCLEIAIEFDQKYVIERTNEVGLPEGSPLSAQEWIEEIAYLNEEAGVKLAHTYYDLCISDPDIGLEAVESLLRENPELASNCTVIFAKAMAYMAKGYQELHKRIETGEVNLPIAESEELRLYLHDEELKYLELALLEIRKIEDTHPELVEKTGRAGTKVDAMAIALERCIPGLVQSTLGKTKLRYFGPKRIKVMPSIDEGLVKPFLDIFFSFPSIVRAALIMSQGRDSKGRKHIMCMLFKRTFDVLGPDDTFGEAGIEGEIYLFDDGTFSTSLLEENAEGRDIMPRRICDPCGGGKDVQGENMENSWRCPYCGLENPDYADACLHCGKPKPKS